MGPATNYSSVALEESFGVIKKTSYRSQVLHAVSGSGQALNASYRLLAVGGGWWFSIYDL